MLFASAGSPAGRWSCFSQFPIASPRCWVGLLINLFLTKRIGGKPVHLPAPVACWISPAAMLTSSTWPLWSWAPSANSGTKDSNMFSWSLREQVKNYTQHICNRNLVFVFQLLAAFLSTRKLLSKTAKFSLVFFILQQKKRSKMGQKQARKVQRDKKGKTGDERPLIKWSEAFHIFQSGQAWLTQGDKRRGKEQLRRQTQ